MNQPSLNMNTNNNNLMDNFKSMIFTMAMVKNTTGQSGSSDYSSLINSIILIVLVSMIDTIGLHIKHLFNAFMTHINKYIMDKTQNVPLLLKSTDDTKKSSIVIKIDKTSTSDAVIDLLTNLPHVKCILFCNGAYTINHNEEIVVAKHIYAKLMTSNVTSILVPTTNGSASSGSSSSSVSGSTSSSSSTSVSSGSGSGNGNGNAFDYIDLYSYTLNMDTLRNELNTIVNNYIIKLSNKLGNDLFFFSELPLILPPLINGQPDLSKMPDKIHFTMKQFVTNRSFKNLFGSDVDIIRKRVDFFKNNKDWYDEKGIPYTLGIMVSGQPGTGKTSIIKCISNELKRHIVNVHLNDTMSKQQLENLFYNDSLVVTQNGRSDSYNIPINKRIYVLEDIDCQCKIILDRTKKTPEQVLIDKNIELTEHISRLNERILALQRGVTTQHHTKHPSQKDEQAGGNNQITLSFLLNLLDGVLETPGRIIIMTTNFVDKLDKAFIRPGRIDIIRKYGFSDYYQMVKIIEHRYDALLLPNQLDILRTLDNCITPAELGRILFENFDDLDGAMQELVQYSKQQMLCITQEQKEQQKESNSPIDIDVDIDMDMNDVNDINDINNINNNF